MKSLRSIGTVTRAKRGQALVAIIAVAGGVAIGTAMSFATRSAPTVAAPLEITPSPKVIGSPLTRQLTPSLSGLTDQNGKAISLTDEKGHVVLLAFMDPLCVDLCPILGRDIVAVEQSLPKGINAVLLIVSDTSGRTPADVRHFVSTNLTTKWLPGWHWLLGPNDALKVVWQAWGEPIEPPKTNYLDVIDPQGYLRVTYPAPLFVSDVVSAVTTVAHE